jgi:pimeloyl-ACP methyl ester carboxylesterase
MANKVVRGPEDYIEPLEINGLEGRVLHMAAPKGKQGKEILFIYGHHSSLERWWGLMMVLNRYAAVTMPDLPGFGGMDNFYKIGMKPSVDNMADYLAAFIKMRYKRKKIAIAGMSFGFVVATRMLQKYPELKSKVTLLVSIVGFCHKDAFLFSKSRHNLYLYGSKGLSTKPLATVFRYTALNPKVLKTLYGKTHNAKHKFAQAIDNEDLSRLQDVEVRLWHDNDVQTWAYTTVEMLQLDNTGTRIDMPLVHVAAKGDHFFDNKIIDQHMKIVFKDYKKVWVNLKNHAPSVIADEKAAAPLVPPTLQRMLRNMP